MTTDTTTQTPTMAQLVSMWNERVAYAVSIGFTKAKPVNSKFKTIEDGVRRLDVLESNISAREASNRAVEREEAASVTEAETAAPAAQEEESDVARKKKTRRAAAAPRSRGNGVTIKEKTDEYNELVPEAKRLGVPYARKHSSAFGSHEMADKQIKRLKTDMASAR